MAQEQRLAADRWAPRCIVYAVLVIVLHRVFMRKHEYERDDLVREVVDSRPPLSGKRIQRIQYVCSRTFHYFLNMFESHGALLKARKNASKGFWINAAALKEF